MSAVEYDLLIRGASVVTGESVSRADVAVSGGEIAAVGTELPGSAREEIDATGLHILPGIIDAHVHLNEPGRAEWEGIETGSKALAAGGGTLFFDMPLNAHPPTTDAESFYQKKALAEKKSFIDFAFWGGLVPGNLERLEELAECGVVGFKAFMANSGIDDFSHVDDHILRQGMKRAARLGLPVAVHAESEQLTQALAQERINSGRVSIRDYLDSRPIAAELDAIRRAIDIAGETRCSLHVVHVSCGAGVQMVIEARGKGVDVSCETCPHYLTFTSEDVERIGALAKCAPPLRSAKERAQLWRHLVDGDITTVGSDHSPSPPAMKQDKSFFKVWGGISGGQHTLSALLAGAEECSESDSLLSQLARALSERVAARFKLPRAKGMLSPGADADLALVDLRQTFEVNKDELFYRHKQSPYAGRRLRGRVVRTLLRGQTIFRDGKIVGNPLGRFVKPQK